VKSEDPRYWGEHFFFELKNLTSDDISSQLVAVKVLDKGFLRDKMVGLFDINVQQIYFQNDDHAILNQWVAITNPESVEKTEVKGYLQLSISVQGPEDNAIKLSDQVALHDTSDESILMPSSIKKEYKQLSISIVEAQDLPKMDTLGSIDAYVQLVYNDHKYKTKVVNPKSGVCTFQQTFQIPLQWPTSKNSLKLSLWDHDATSDEVVASIDFTLKELVDSCSKPGGEFKWINIYGAHTGLVDGPNMAAMNRHPEIASKWKGRVLFHIQVTDSKSPAKGVQPMDESIMRLANYRQWRQPIKYQVQVEFGAGICLPNKSTKYKLRVGIGNFVISSDSPKETKPHYCRWSQRIANKGFESPCQTLEELDRVYVYLVEDDKTVCFWRGRVADFVNKNPEFQWLPLANDLAVGKVKEAYKAGLVQVKIAVNSLKNNPLVNWSQYPTWALPPPPRFSTYRLRCFIFQCKDLPNADEDSQTDCYVEVWNPLNNEAKTEVVADNLNPIFYQAIDVTMEFDSIQTAPPIVFRLWDRDESLLDKLGGPKYDDDDYLGCTNIKLTDANIVVMGRDDKQEFRNFSNVVFTQDENILNSIPKPKWHDVRFGFKDQLPAQGQVLCSFVLAEKDQFLFTTPSEHVNLSNEVKTSEYNVDIHVCRLRNLQSFGILPIKKPFIQFSIKSLLPPREAMAVENVQTAPKATGSNPVINEEITFTTRLPVDKLYCPKLSCEVFDNICKGWSQPTIGTFTLDIGSVIQKQLKTRRGWLSNSDQSIARIQDKIKVTPQFTGQIVDDDVSSKMRYARALGFEAEETVSAFSDLLNNSQSKQKLKKKKKKTQASKAASRLDKSRM
jgi:hypothetical protein